MAIVNRRNAVFGWAVWQVGKRVARRRARALVPGRKESGGGRGKGIAAALAALGGLLFVWRRRGGDDELVQ